MPDSTPHSELRERALTWLRGRRSDDGETEDIINGLLEQLETAPTEREMRCFARVIDGVLYPLEGDFTDILNEAFAALRRIMPMLDGSNPANEPERG